MRFQPSILYTENNKYKKLVYSDYKLLKKHLKSVIQQSDEEVTVSRSRRGEWGEWYEKWVLDSKGKPVNTSKNNIGMNLVWINVNYTTIGLTM